MAVESCCSIPNPYEKDMPFLFVTLSNINDLTNLNYPTWERQVQVILEGLDLFKYPDGSYPPPQEVIMSSDTPPKEIANPALQTWKRQDKLVYGVILPTLSDSVAALVTQTKTSAELWAVIKGMFAKDLHSQSTVVSESSEAEENPLDDKQQEHQTLLIQRLEERLKNLESENEVLHQQALSMAQNNKLLALRSRAITLRTEGAREVDLHNESMVVRESSEEEEKPLKTLNDKHQEHQTLLIRCMSQHLGFSKGRPVIAAIIFRCLRQWRSFEVEKTSIFDRIIQTIGLAIQGQDNNEILAYWLTNTSSLMLLLQHTLKASATAGPPQRRRSSSASLFGRMAQSFHGVPQNVDLASIDGEVHSLAGGLDISLTPIEAQYPAMLFKQQLTAYVEKIYGMIRDNLKKEISPSLGLCIQAPRTTKANSPANGGASVNEPLFTHWKGIVQTFSKNLKLMGANYVPSFLIRKVYTQVFWFINVQLFNSLLLRRECCSFTNAQYVKMGLAELENWCDDASDEYAGSAWEELKDIRQAIGFLVTHEKPQKTLDEVSHYLCPALSIQQLYRISTMYWDDKYGAHSLSSEVISNMKVLMTEDSNNAVSNSFLLDDDSSIPFSADELAKSTEQITISDIEPPPLIREHSGFGFLIPVTE